MPRNRYSYNVYSDNELIGQFSSLNTLLNRIDLPTEKTLEIARHFRPSKKQFEKQNMNSYHDKAVGLRIDVRILNQS